jgi:ubiquitin-protein ligase
MSAKNKRQLRLAQEWQRLQAVNRDSDYVRVQPIDVLPNRQPEKYKVTFQCRGITGIDASNKPIYGAQHEVQIYCHADFPTDVPWLQWQTPIWHPNIEHSGEKRVCVNKAEWLGGMALADLCQQMFEMVQYKNYHAELSPPYPLDSGAATWVRDYAEREGIVDKKRGIFVDNLPFYRPGSGEAVRRIHIIKGTTSSPGALKIKIHGSKAPAHEPESRVVMEAGASSIPCPGCGTNLAPDSKFCGRCGAEIGSANRRVRFGA